MSNLNHNHASRSSNLSKPRARHQMKRSLTELTSPARLPRQHHNLLRHRPSHDDQGSADAQAPLQTRHSVGLLRPDGAASSTMSSDLSRHASLSAQKGDAGEIEAKHARGTKLEQEKASIRAGILKQSVADLGTFSTSMTKQLDATYYVVLEKMSTLQNTITAMKGLAETLRDMCDGFDSESRALESDTVGKLEAMGRFEEQQARICSLQDRVRQGRARIQTLTDRVDVVKERIEGWERADRDWREKTRKRLKIFWSVTSAVAIFMIVLAIGIKNTTPRLDDAHGNASGAGSAVRPWSNVSVGPTPAEGEGDREAGKTTLWKSTAAGEPLRAFDEL